MEARVFWATMTGQLDQHLKAKDFAKAEGTADSILEMLRGKAR